MYVSEYLRGVDLHGLKNLVAEINQYVVNLIQWVLDYIQFPRNFQLGWTNDTKEYESKHKTSLNKI